MLCLVCPSGTFFPFTGRRESLMGAYILRRILLMIPTLFGIMAVSFAVIQFAPGGPVEQIISRLQNPGGGGDVLSGGGSDVAGNFDAGGGASSRYRGAQG